MWRRSSTQVWTGSVTVRLPSVSRARPLTTTTSTTLLPITHHHTRIPHPHRRTNTTTFSITRRLFRTAIGSSEPNSTEEQDMGAKGTHRVNTTERLENLRELMKRSDVAVDAFVVPSEDQRAFFMLCYLSLETNRLGYVLTLFV